MSQKQQAKTKLQTAIQNNTSLDWLLYDTIKEAKVQVGPITLYIWPELNKNLKDYKEVWKQLTAPQGRKYIKDNLDCLLDYVDKLIGE